MEPRLDAKKRKTIATIEAALDEMLENEQISSEDYFRQVVYIIHDFVECEDYQEAVRVVQKLDSDFIETLNKTQNTDYGIKAKEVYEKLGLAHCKPKINGVNN